MPRVLLFLFDGTGNEPVTATESEPTNVFKINSLIAESRKIAREHSSQVTFYVPGIGTKFTSRGIAGKIRQIIFGDGLGEMVMRSYVNLSANYRSGDSIVVIGFSRGAVAARLFSRLVTDFGLFKANKLRFFSDMFESFSDAIDLDFIRYQNKAEEFKDMHSAHLVKESPRIEFMGLFDCVRGSADSDYQNFLTSIDQDQSRNIRRYLHLMSLHDMRGHFELARLNALPRCGRELWMPGVHSDVGGGYRDDLIARISLLTMALALHEEADVALEGEALSTLQNEIKVLLNDRFAVNRESDFGPRKNRSAYFKESDKLHFIHFKLVGQSVFWKNEGSVVYEGKVPLAEDVWSKKLLAAVAG